MTDTQSQSIKISKTALNSLGRIRSTFPTFMTLAMLLAMNNVPANAIANTPQLIPHRAVYDFVLDESEESNLVTGAKGRYVYELSGNRCEGFTTNSRFLLKSTNYIGNTNTYDSRSSYYENVENSSFQFFHKTYLNERAFEESKGNAARNLQNITVDLDTPEDVELTIAKETLFPIELTAKTIIEAQKGTKFLTESMYDGAEDGRTRYSISIVIGPPDEMSKTDKTVELIEKNLLEDSRFWPVTYSFFDQDGSQFAEQTPDFQILMNLHENGISSDLSIKYRDYSLVGGLTELRSLPIYDCDS